MLSVAILADSPATLPFTSTASQYSKCRLSGVTATPRNACPGIMTISVCNPILSTADASRAVSSTHIPLRSCNTSAGSLIYCVASPLLSDLNNDNLGVQSNPFYRRCQQSGQFDTHPTPLLQHLCW